MELVPATLLPQFEDYRWLEDHRTPTDPTRKAKWLRHREIAWDTTTRKYTPSMLKGYRPITLEPWADDSIRFGEERALGFDPWGTGKSWEQEVPEVQATLFDQVLRYHDWRIKRERLKNVLQTTDEYRLLRA